MTTYTTIKTADINVETNEVVVNSEYTKIADITEAIDPYVIAVANGYVGTKNDFYNDLGKMDGKASSISLDPTTIDNVTITATNVQEAFEQQETKSINGGYF